MKYLILLSLVFVFSSCRPEQMETNYNEVNLRAAQNAEADAMCLPYAEEQCELKEGCQSLLNDDQIYQKCIGKIIVVDDDRAPADDGEEAKGKKKVAVDDDAEYEACKDKDDEEELDDKKIVICHVPHGNPANRHSICISKNGWLHGHKDRHGIDEDRDHLGRCLGDDADDDADDE